MDPSEGISGSSAGNPDVLLGCCKIAPAHQCLERDGAGAFVSVVAGRGGTQAEIVITVTTNCREVHPRDRLPVPVRDVFRRSLVLV